MTPSVSVVTTAFGSTRKVVQWAESWLATGSECVVCDNGGLLTPGILPEGVRLLAWRGNDGFGQGVNRAAEASTGDVVLITNPDTLPGGKGCLGNMLCFHAPGTITGGITVNRGGERIPSSGLWPGLPWIRKQLLSRAASLWSESGYDWIQGALMMVHREEFLALGGFSPRFPLYFEDTDLCARAVAGGMRVSLCEESVFLHEEGTGSSGRPGVRLAGFHWGLCEFFRSHRPGLYREARRLILLKCLSRMIHPGLFKPEYRRGYSNACRALLSGVMPGLPERARD